MCRTVVPGAQADRSVWGSPAVVAKETIGCEPSASARSATAETLTDGTSAAQVPVNASARAGSMSWTTASRSSGRAAARKRRISRLMTPQPTRTTPVGGACSVSTRAASAALAAVRLAEMTEPSRKAVGRPFSRELRVMLALARSMPAATLPGNEAIHFIPATGDEPPP